MSQQNRWRRVCRCAARHEFRDHSQLSCRTIRGSDPDPALHQLSGLCRWHPAVGREIRSCSRQLGDADAARHRGLDQAVPEGCDALQEGSPVGDFCFCGSNVGVEEWDPGAFTSREPELRTIGESAYLPPDIEIEWDRTCLVTGQSFPPQRDALGKTSLRQWFQPSPGSIGAGRDVFQPDQPKATLDRPGIWWLPFISHNSVLSVNAAPDNDSARNHFHAKAIDRFQYSEVADAKKLKKGLKAFKNNIQ